MCLILQSQCHKIRVISILGDSEILSRVVSEPSLVVGGGGSGDAGGKWMVAGVTLPDRDYKGISELTLIQLIA